MFDVLDIIRRNAQTYYSLKNNRPINRWPIVLLCLSLSIACGIVIRRISPEFLAGALSAQSILVGFSFNALFYLVTNRLVTPKSWLFIEHELRFKRLSKLSDEIFDNISYFNIVALLSIGLNLCLLLKESDFALGNEISSVLNIFKLESCSGRAFQILGKSITAVLICGLVFTLIEGLTSFTRIIYRVRFYFEMLKLMNEDNLKAQAQLEEHVAV